MRLLRNEKSVLHNLSTIFRESFSTQYKGTILPYVYYAYYVLYYIYNAQVFGTFNHLKLVQEYLNWNKRLSS